MIVTTVIVSFFILQWMFATRIPVRHVKLNVMEIARTESTGQTQFDSSLVGTLTDSFCSGARIFCSTVTTLQFYAS